MAKVLSTGLSFDGAVSWLLSDGSGRNIPIQVIDTATFTASWASVLAVGNTSGGSDVVISGTDELQFDLTPGTALIRVADAVRWVAGGIDSLYLDNSVLRIESAVELELDTNPGPAVIRGTDGLTLNDGASPVLVLDSEIRPQVNLIRWAETLAPTISQSTSTTGAGAQMTIRPQAGLAGTAVGGSLLLTSGSGTTSGNVILRPNTGSGSNGAVQIQQPVGPTTAITVGPSGLAFWGGVQANRPSITGSRGGNAALASLLTALDSMGLITNNTTA